MLVASPEKGPDTRKHYVLPRNYTTEWNSINLLLLAQVMNPLRSCDVVRTALLSGGVGGIAWLARMRMRSVHEAHVTRVRTTAASAARRPLIVLFGCGHYRWKITA
jgi:hypothetical protein